MKKNAHKLILLPILFILALTLTNVTLASENENNSETENSQPATATGSDLRLKNVREVKENNLPTTANVKEQVREKIEEKRQETVQTKCEVITKNINKRLEIFSENKDKHVERYSELKEKVAELVTKLETRGYDVTALKNDLLLLDEKIQKFAADYVIFIDQLKQTQSFACGQSEGAYAQALTKAKTQLRLIREDALDIKNFYLNVIKADLRELREQSKVMEQEQEQQNTENSQESTE